jgi:hypothetical protein
VTTTDFTKMPKGQPSGKRVNWDDVARGKLSIAILEACNIETIPWTVVVERSGIDGLTAVAAQ